MKKFVLFLALLGLILPLAADGHMLPEHQFAQGDWMLKGDRLYQSAENDPLAKVNIRVPQEGAMIYEFNVRYEGGAEDLHGGFGIHVFADQVHPRKSWGSGKSYLLWLNYDADPVSDSIPAGFSAQVYRSLSHSKMELVRSVDLNQWAYLLTSDNLDLKIPAKIYVDGDTGYVKVYSPVDPNYYFYFTLGNDDPMEGKWIALRSNSLALSFGR